MPNPTQGTGSISFPAAAAVEKFRLVSLSEEGVQHADASGAYGVVTEAAAPESERADNFLAHGLPKIVAVHRYGVVPIEADDASSLTPGTVVAAAADGKVSASGEVKVGTVVGPKGGADNLVNVDLRIPLG
ncbi:MAG: hypothetical protein Q4F65_05855 [Propionibacteriaceae bacterium]|nr:hypothetical protein [Propionibacteriaceae bacterium]